MDRAWTHAGTIGLGAALMYVLDPDRGRRRRAVIRDKLVHFGRRGSCALRAVSMDVLSRTKGVLSEVDTLFRRSAASDAVLAARVRAKIGRIARHPHAVAVTAENGRVVLSGPVVKDDVPRLLDGARSVRGVCALENRLVIYEREDDPKLRGDPVRHWRLGDPSTIPELWGRSTRFFAGASGVALGLYGAYRQDLVGIGWASVGIGLLARAGTNRDLKLVAAALRGELGIQRSVEVELPIERAYDLWQKPHTLERAFTFAREIEQRDNRRLRWRVRGPSGAPIEWETTFTRVVPNELIAWHTAPGSVLEHEGVVRFEKLSPERTRVAVRMSFWVADGRRALLGLFTRDPGKELEEDLERFRAVAETTGRDRHVPVPEPIGVRARSERSREREEGPLPDPIPKGKNGPPLAGGSSAGL